MTKFPVKVIVSQAEYDELSPAQRERCVVYGPQLSEEQQWMRDIETHINRKARLTHQTRRRPWDAPGVSGALEAAIMRMRLD